MKPPHDRFVRGLRKLGFTGVRRAAPGPYFTAARGKRRFAIELEAVAPYRASDLRGRMAEAILHLQKHGGGAKQLVAIYLPRLTPSAMEAIEVFIDEYAAHASWIAFDEQGSWKWRLEGTRGREAAPRPVARPKSSRVFDPFAPKSEWALKVLLLAGIDEKYFGLSKQQFASPPSSVQQLHRISGVAQSHVWNLVDNLRRLEYLAAVPDLRFRDVRRLIEDWARARRAKASATTAFAKPLFASETRAACLGRLAGATSSSGTRVIVGSFEACRRLGVARSSVEMIRLYANDPPGTLMKTLDLAPSNPAEAWIELAPPEEFNLVSGASVLIERTPVTDILQCLLDVRYHPVRGGEQAEFILESILMPHFRERGWD